MNNLQREMMGEGEGHCAHSILLGAIYTTFAVCTRHMRFHFLPKVSTSQLESKLRRPIVKLLKSNG